MLPINNYLVSKYGTNNTQVLHRMRLSQFTPLQSSPDIRILRQEWKLDLEVNLEHDGLYARAWECEYDKPIFDAEKNNATPPNSSETPVQSDLSTKETSNTPGTAQECSRETFPQTEHLCNVIDTYPYMEPDAETNSEQPHNRPTNPHSSKYNLRHNPKLNCNDDLKFYFLSCTDVFHITRT